MNLSDLQWVGWFHDREFSFKLSFRLVRLPFVINLEVVWDEYPWHPEISNANLGIKIQ